jgi:hypothetical protein
MLAIQFLLYSVGFPFASSVKVGTSRTFSHKNIVENKSVMTFFPTSMVVYLDKSERDLLVTIYHNLQEASGPCKKVSFAVCNAMPMDISLYSAQNKG